MCPRSLFRSILYSKLLYQMGQDFLDKRYLSFPISKILTILLIQFSLSKQRSEPSPDQNWSRIQDVVGGVLSSHWCCCLPCNHRTKSIWVLEEMLTFGNRLRSTHCRELLKDNNKKLLITKHTFLFFYI